MLPFITAEVLVFLAASLLTLALIYIKLPISSLQQILAIFLVLILIIVNKFIFKIPNQKLKNIVKNSLLFLLAFFVQLLIISTGGLASPFLILLHIFTLAVSFIITLYAALTFLFFSALILVAGLYFNPLLAQAATHDIGSTLLYLSSLLVIVPLSIFISRNYHFKDSLLGSLKKELSLAESEQTAILQGISEMVFVTDKNLNIISCNEAAEKIFSKSNSQIINHQLFDILLIKDSSGRFLNKKYFAVNNIKFNSNQPLEDLLLYSRNTTQHKKVNLRIRSIAGLDGQISQITFVVSDSSAINPNKPGHIDLEEARTNHEALVEQLKRDLLAKGLVDLRTRALLVGKTEQDILSAIELEHHSPTQQEVRTDVANLLKKSVDSENDFARALKVSLTFSIVNFGQRDIAPLVPKGFKVDPLGLTSAFFTAPVNIKWLDLLIQKLIEVAMLISSGNPSPQVQISIDREGEYALVISIKANSALMSESEKILLVTEYYGALQGSTNLHLGSGLEGYLAKVIASELHIPLTIETNQSGFIFKLHLEKGF